MKFLFLSNVYLLVSSVFPITALVLFPCVLLEVKTVELIIFTIGSYWFNIDIIIKSLMIQINGRRE